MTALCLYLSLLSPPSFFFYVSFSLSVSTSLSVSLALLCLPPPSPCLSISFSPPPLFHISLHLYICMPLYLYVPPSLSLPPPPSLTTFQRVLLCDLHVFTGLSLHSQSFLDQEQLTPSFTDYRLFVPHQPNATLKPDEENKQHSSL